MCRGKDHGGRRCKRTSRTSQLNTINQRIRRNRIKVETMSDGEEKAALQRRIAEDEKLKESLRVNKEETTEAVTPVSVSSTSVEEDSPAPEKTAAERIRELLDNMKEDSSYAERSRLRRLLEREKEVERLRKERPLAPLPPGKKKVSIFRSGTVEAPANRGVEKDVYEIADSIKPEGRVGRTEGIFAAPTLYGVTRWVRGNSVVGRRDINVREITVDPDEVYVYSIEAWEDGSWGMDDMNPSSYQDFWDSGMTLRQWYDRGVDDGDKWELLLAPEHVQNVKNVSAKRAAEAAEDGWRDNVLLLLSNRSRRR